MTKEQKALVVKLRDKGMTFAAIAEKLDISVNSSIRPITPRHAELKKPW